MALSKKAFRYLAAIVVLLVLAGFGTVQYIQKTVAEAVKTEVAKMPEAFRPSLGEVTYSLFENTLTVKEIQLTTKIGALPVSAKIGLASIKNLNIDLVKFLIDPNLPIPEALKKTPLQPLADEFRIEKFSAGPTFTGHLDNLSISSIQVDPVKAQAAFKLFIATSNSKQEDALQQSLAQASTLIPEALAYSSLSLKNMMATFPSEAGPITLELAEEHQKDYDRGHLGSVTVSGLQVSGAAVGEFSLAKLTASELNPPSQELSEKFSLLFEKSDDPQAKAFFPLLQQVFGNTKPFLGSFELSQALIKLPDAAPVSFENFTYSNPKTSPFTYSIKMSNLNIPTDIDSNLAMLKLVGINSLMVSWEVSGSAPNPTDGLFSKQINLSINDMGSIRLDTLGLIPPKDYESLLTSKEPMSSAITQLFDAARLSKMSMSYTDKGLLPRAAMLSKQFTGQTVEQAIAETSGELKGFSEENQKKILAFLQHPGTIELAFTPKQPLPFKDVATLLDGSDMITFTTTPGQVSLQDLVNQLKSK